MRLDVVPLEEFIANGDWDESLSKILELKTITKPKFDGVVLHRFPDGKLTGVGSLPASANGFEGLEDVTITRNYSETKSVELQFSFEFLNHRDGKDIYFFEWHAYQIRQSAKDEVGSRGGGASGQMAYDGTPMTLHGGKHGTTKLMSRELAIGEDGEYVDGSDQVVSQ